MHPLRSCSSPNACEYAFHGRDADANTQCCPHGITRKQGPPEDCCMDDLPKTPYRVEYVASGFGETTTEMDFQLRVVNVSGIDTDLLEPAVCDKMSLDYAQIQLYKHVVVEKVMWGTRQMSFNVTSSTDYSNWLNINNIDRFITDFDPADPVKFTLTLRGFVREPCPGTMIFETSAAPVCQYVLHGRQSAYTCCPLGFTGRGRPEDECGCRDDLAETPFRLAYTLAGGAPSDQSMFNFDLARVDPKAVKDYDMQWPDHNVTRDFSAVSGLEVACGGMNIKDLVFAVHADTEVVDVAFNGFNYTYQFEAHSDPKAKWLRVLDLDYSTWHLSATRAAPLSVVVKGSPRELCPASSLFGSQAACHYFILGKNEAYDECCPASVTSWFMPMTGSRR